MKVRRSNRAAQHQVPAVPRFVADGVYRPSPFQPPRAGSMRASELPSRVADRLYFPRRRGAGAKA